MPFNNKFSPTASGEEEQTEIMPKDLKYITKDDYFNRDDFNYNTAQLGHEIYKANQKTIEYNNERIEQEKKLNTIIKYSASFPTGGGESNTQTATKEYQKEIVGYRYVNLDAVLKESPGIGQSYIYYVKIPKIEGANKYEFLTGASLYWGIQRLSKINEDNDTITIECRSTKLVNISPHHLELNFLVIGLK